MRVRILVFVCSATLVFGLFAAAPVNADVAHVKTMLITVQAYKQVPFITGTLTPSPTPGKGNGQELDADGAQVQLFRYVDNIGKEYFLFGAQSGYGAPINQQFSAWEERNGTVQALAYALAHERLATGSNGNSVKDGQVDTLLDTGTITSAFSRMQVMQNVIWNAETSRAMIPIDEKAYGILDNMIKQSNSGAGDSRITDVEFVSTGDDAGKLILTYNGYVPAHKISVTAAGGTAIINGGADVRVGPYAVGASNQKFEIPVTNVNGEVTFTIKDEAPYLSGNVWGKKYMENVGEPNQIYGLLVGHADFHWYEVTVTVRGPEATTETTTEATNTTEATTQNESSESTETTDSSTQNDTSEETAFTDDTTRNDSSEATDASEGAGKEDSGQGTQTGDHSNMPLYIILLAVAAITAIAATTPVIRRKFIK